MVNAGMCAAQARRGVYFETSTSQVESLPRVHTNHATELGLHAFQANRLQWNDAIGRGSRHTLAKRPESIYRVHAGVERISLLANQKSTAGRLTLPASSFPSTIIFAATCPA